MASIGGFFKAVGKVSYPFLTMAAQAGGPFTALAAQALGKTLGIDGGVDATPDAIEKKMQEASLDGDQLLKLREAENNLQVTIQQMTNEKIKSAQDFEAHLDEISAKDRDSARNREIQVKDPTPRVLAYIYTLGFFSTLYAEIWIAVKQFNLNPLAMKSIDILLGILIAMMIGVKEYFFGSSSGSARKTELLAQAPSITSGKEGEGK